jgi:hypothetical protein
MKKSFYNTGLAAEIKKAKFDHNPFQKRPKEGQILPKNLLKYIKQILEFHKMLYILRIFCQNMPKKILF